MARAVVRDVVAVAACCALAACGLETSGLSPVDAGANDSDPYAGQVTRDATAVAIDATLAAGDAGNSQISPPDASGGPPAADGSAPSKDASVADARDDVGVPGPVSCDADGDGHRAIACGGDDCCDLDAEVYPRLASRWWPGANRCGGFDHDCDGIVYLRHGQASCSMPGQACRGEGFVTIPVCGVTGRWAECTLASGICAPDVTSSYPKMQECR